MPYPRLSFGTYLKKNSDLSIKLDWWHSVFSLQIFHYFCTCSSYSSNYRVVPLKSISSTSASIWICCICKKFSEFKVVLITLSWLSWIYVHVCVLVEMKGVMIVKLTFFPNWALVAIGNDDVRRCSFPFRLLLDCYMQFHFLMLLVPPISFWSPPLWGSYRRNPLLPPSAWPFVKYLIQSWFCM